MPSYTKAHPYSDKENFSEQQEQVQCCKIKAQRECKCLQLHQLAEAWSENDELEGIAGDDHSGLKDDNNDDDDRDNGTQLSAFMPFVNLFTSHVVAMKLSGITREHLMYSKNKVPKAPPTTIDINREIASSDNEDINDPFISPCPSSDHKSSQHKKTKERHTGHTTPEVEDTTPARDKREVPSIRVTSHGSQVCSQLKTKLCPLIEAMFSFHSSQSKNLIKKYGALAEGLKEGTNFAFKHMSANEDGQCGFLKVPLIQKIINTMWFANKHDDGVVLHDYFKPFPLLALALVLATVY
ncbi:hypothetical protein EDC04DRAFT_2604104 [Pisolithus marmoratus]|nr:hypothetical protein EDC04DRAFT_2604104 [Pisolithus marmoratus]